MKKVQLLASFLIILSQFSFAQKDTKAKEILAEVSKKYRSYDIIKSEFTFTLDNAQAKVKEIQQGTLLAKANSNKYKIIMTNQDLISDGKTVWTFLKRDKEVQINNVDNNKEALNPAKIFTLYEKGFKYIYNGENNVGNKTIQLIDLSPIDTKKAVFKVSLSIDKATKQIVNIVVFEKSGSKYIYKVKSFTPNVKIPESTFVFDVKKNPGVEVVDLR